MNIKKIFLSLLAGVVGVTVMGVSAMADEYVAHFNKSGEQFTTLQAAIDKIVEATDEEHIILDTDVNENVVLNQAYVYKIYLNTNTLNGQIKIERGALTLHGCSIIHQGRGAITGGIHCISTEPNSAHIYLDTVDISNGSGDAILLESQSLDLQLISDVTVNGNVVVKNGEFIVADNSQNLVNGTITKEIPGTVSLRGGCYTEDPSALLGNTQKAVYDATKEVWTIEAVAPATTIEDFAKDSEGAYLISTADELVVFHNELSAGGASTFEGKVFKLTNDIDLAGKVFVTTGKKDNRFGGTFDGLGYALENLVVDGEGKDYAGFFGSLGVNGTVKNVKVKNAKVTGKGYVGVLIGQSRSSSLVENCSVSGEIEVTATGSYVAGIIGHMQSANGIKNCSVTGTGTISGGAQVGGIVGTVSNSGKVEANSVSGIAIDGNAAVGGIVGFLLPNATEISGNTVSNIEIEGNSGTGLVIGEILTNSNEVTVGNNTTTESTINGDKSNTAYGVIDSAKIVAIVNGTPYGTLDAAIDAVQSGDNEIEVMANTAEDVTIPQTEGVNIVLDGNGNEFSGTIYLDGNSRHTGAETLKITNFNFSVEATKNHDFISANSADSAVRYAHNVTVEDCTFTATGNTDEFDVVGMRYRQTYNMNVNNCTFTNMHSAMWATGVSNGLVIDTIETVGCKNGISTATSSNVTVKNSTIEATAEGGYGIRTDASGAYSLTIEATEIEAYNPVILRNANNTNYSLTVEAGCSFAKTNPDGYDITVTSGSDDAAFVKPANDIKIDIDPSVEASLFSTHVASIGGVYYKSLDAALTAAQKDDVIDLLGNTFEITSINITKNMHTKNLTFQNGTMDFTNAVAGNSLFDMTANQSIKFKDMTLLIKDREEGSAMCYWMDLRAATAVAYFENCFIDFDAVQYSYICANGDGKVFFTDCTIEAEQANFVYRAGATFENCTFDGYAGLSEGESAGNVILWAAVPCTIKNSTINTRQLGSITANGTIAIIENSYVYAERVRHYYAADSANYTAGLVTVDATSTLEAVELDIGMINEASEGKITSEASSVYIQYKKTDLDENGNDTNEKADVYEIVLAGANNNAAKEIINELASADITFNFVGTPVEGGAMDYTVKGAQGVTVTQLGDSDRFMFNYNGVDKYEETGTAIVIGTVTVSGYGTYYLGTATDNVTTNAVYATEIRDNIVDGFEAAGDLVVNTDMLEDDGMVGEIDGGEILVPTRELRINIDFPNTVTTGNAVAYQQMTVTISGGDLEEALVIKLGDEAEITDLAKFVSKTGNKNVTAVASDNAYDITVAGLLKYETAYNVEVSGAGYRTARYTVTMNCDESKTLNFWNNVKDNTVEVEEDKASSAKNITFLAGDIVKDNDINIYDLSAVVSYFGEEELGVDKHPEYAKYDLNRDGKIDSKDVAYVLVSWNN